MADDGDLGGVGQWYRGHPLPNVASAVAAAGRLCPPAEPYARDLLAVLEPTSPVPQGFRRTSCCLYYRAGFCADCVLVR